MLYTPAFAALYAANLFLVASFSAFFLFPLFIAAQGGSQQDIGIIMGAFALASALCRPWVAEMIDRFGRKRSYTLGCIIMTIMPLSHLLLHGTLSDIYVPLLLIRMAHGVGLAICFTAVFTFIVDLIPKGRLNEGIGMFGTSGLVGLAIGPAIAEPVLNQFGYSAFFSPLQAWQLWGCWSIYRFATGTWLKVLQSKVLSLFWPAASTQTAAQCRPGHRVRFRTCRNRELYRPLCTTAET